MATEKTLAKPLSGPEVIEAIVTKIREQLARDCFLAPHIAYPSFSFTAELYIEFQGSRISSTQAHVKDSQGEKVEGVESQSSNVSVQDKPKPPNQVREETEQPIPIAVKTPTGRVEERKVKYARRPPNPPAA